MAPSVADDQRIENVVAEARLGGPFDIPLLSKRLIGSEYHPQRFIGLIVHVPHGSALIFEDGHVVVTGARGVEEALVQIEHVRDLLSKAGVETTSMEGFHVRNLVLSHDVGGEVALDQVQLAFDDEDMEYDPEAFPGLVVHVHEPRCTLLLFRSGRMVATGTGDLPGLENAVDSFVGALQERGLVRLGDAGAPATPGAA